MTEICKVVSVKLFKKQNWSLALSQVGSILPNICVMTAAVVSTDNVSSDDGGESQLWENDFLQEPNVSWQTYEYHTLITANGTKVEIVIIKPDCPSPFEGW